VSGVGATDAWTVLGALAARTRTLRLGTLVSPVTFRDPAVLARAALTVDLISDGRVEIGMGAGWWEEEHTRFGIPFYDVGRRWEMLEEQVPIVHGLFTEDDFSFQGKHYQLDGADQLPRSVQRPRPPLILGGTAVGPRMQALIGAFADEFNTVGGTPAKVGERFARARQGVATAGREQASLVTSLMTWVFVGRTEAEYLERLRRAHALDPKAGPFDAYRADIEADCIVGTPAQAIEQLNDYAAVGVQRVFLNHELYDDAEMVELIATDVLPEVR
jgi:alkanesulfonate monooxygenase SsuD/methylene tetrahydromethanopterin reductase-like flavin-dependent oxidoreductase (luciferase family)